MTERVPLIVSLHGMTPWIDRHDVEWTVEEYQRNDMISLHTQLAGELIAARHLTFRCIMFLHHAWPNWLAFLSLSTIQGYSGYISLYTGISLMLLHHAWPNWLAFLSLSTIQGYPGYISLYTGISLVGHLNKIDDHLRQIWLANRFGLADIHTDQIRRCEETCD